MVSPLGILLNFLRRLRPTKHHIKHFLKLWTPLFAYLVRKISDWRFLWPSNPGTIRNHKPAESSSPSRRENSSSVSDGSVCTGGIGGYVVAASTVPTSAKQSLGGERADPPSDTAPPTPPLPKIPWSLDLSTINPIVGSSHAHHSSRSLSVRSRASDRFSTISSRISLAQSDRPSHDRRATHRQFGRGPYLVSQSEIRNRSSKSLSPPSPDRAESENLRMSLTGGHSYARDDGVINPTISPQGVTDLSSTHTQEWPTRLVIGRPNQKTTSVGGNVPSSEWLPTTSINVQEITEEPVAIDTSTHIPLHISPSDRAETASLNPDTISSVASVLALPEGRILKLITSEQIPRYTKNTTT